MKMSTLFAILAVLLASCRTLEDKGSLEAPSDIKVEQTGLAVVRLTWNNTSSTYDGVILERASGEDEFSEIARPGNGVLVYNDKNHSEDTEYRYRLTTYRGTETSAPAMVSFSYSRLPMPEDATCELTANGLVLTWNDKCTGEEGYMIKRRKGEGKLQNWKTLEPNSTTVTDGEVTSGSYYYEICAFYGEEFSKAAKIHFENFTEPSVFIDNIQASWHMVNIPMVLKDDGGYVCEGGICWKNDGSKGATLNDNVYAFPEKIRSGDTFFGNAIGLEYGKEYSFRPWIRYDGNIRYYSEKTARLLDEPEALHAEWIEISEQYALPQSIRLYKTETYVTGRKVNAWYAVADMSSGELELRTFKTSTSMTPSEAAGSGIISDDVMIMVNGGYFGGGQSYSYVMNQGKEEATGVKSVTRSFYGDENRTNVNRSYNITRGAFGVDKDQNPSVKWLYGSNQWAYDKPLPAYNSGPVLHPNNIFPSPKHIWDIYSAIGGGPVILDEGRLCFDYLLTKDKGNGGRYIGNPELLGDDIFGPSVRPPRTAIGHTADGKIIILVADGRDAGGSQGLSLDELARLMKGIGCTDALNLDGGGSTVMCATPSGKILNVPSDGKERQVLSFVAIVKKQ